MILCFDIGNTDIDTGVFENDRLLKTFNIHYVKSRSAHHHVRTVRQALSENGVDISAVRGCVLCSVVKSTTDPVKTALTEIFGFAPLLFSSNICDIDIKTDNPSEVGTDIIAACLAVKKKYSMPAIVIDMGTATTVTAMDSEGAILGVSIITGAVSSLWALNARTGLPVDYELIPPPKVIGTNTADSIASGGVYGYAYMMDGMIKAFEKEIGAPCSVYATGGLSKVIMPLCESKSTVNTELLLEGLYVYYKTFAEK